MDAAAAAQTAAIWYLPFVIPICLWVAYSDLSRMKIPNKAVVALTAVFLAIAIFVFPLAEVGLRILQLLVVLAITFLMTVIRIIGAGDAKFAAAMAPFVMFPEDMTMLLGLFAVATVVGFTTHRLARAIPAIRRATPNWESWVRKKDFPMGYPLSATLMIYLIMKAMGL